MSIKKRCLGMLALVVATACLSVAETVHGHDDEKSGASVAERPAGDMVCGSRCVQFLLRHYGYGKDVDLIDLARETQWPDFEAGAPLDALERSLQKRGIYTAALRIDPRDRLCWPHPVLVHLKGSSDIGHYVVWLPSSAVDRAEVWAGLSGIQAGEADRLAERRSGVILLTSPEPIAHPEAAVYRPMRVFPWLFAAVSLALLLAVLKPGVYRPLRQLAGSTIGTGGKKRADSGNVSNAPVRVPLP